ncbi:ArsR/SmtB family transcription factor [Sphingomonas rubra]|uniref:Transcriptional regulator, ArsR family n=1 Tax=Sphingomonas rubra TaxID=634430 RepID=A0A1I5R9W8_9SPHN|nr:metalloregulator ArsR/SmtB family transcription factor [Sphingomonas rubra]SFP55309.1 transcriptional regulator, ArsR family [Sphingomonas rubra]
MTVPLSRDRAADAAERLRAFAQPQRLMILSALVGRELAVGVIDAETAIGQPALSQQLAELRRAGLVATRRESKQVLYRLADDRTAAIVRFVAAVFGGDAAPHDAIDAPAQPAPGGTRSAAMFAVIDR